MKSKQWFIDRIGERVYRGPTTCKCPICSRVLEDGLVISSETHAIYLYNIQGELQCPYYDSKEEAINDTTEGLPTEAI